MEGRVGDLAAYQLLTLGPGPFRTIGALPTSLEMGAGAWQGEARSSNGELRPLGL